MRKQTTGDVLVSRVIQILIKLYNQEHLSKSDLAYEFGVSERTIQRDIMQRLELLPIKKDSLGRYYLQDTKILKSYKQDLLEVLNDILDMKVFNSEIIEKVINIPYFPVGFQLINSIDNLEIFKKLNIAILEKKIVSAIYDGKTKILNPYKLINYSNNWYLLATEHGQLRVFYLYSLKALVIKNDSFTHDKRIVNKIIRKENFFIPHSSKKEVVLEINELVKEYFLNEKKLANYQIMEHKDNKIILSTMVNIDDELFRFIWQFIPFVRILSPKDLVEKNKNKIKEYLFLLKS